jgi:hypothetical protein
MGFLDKLFKVNQKTNSPPLSIENDWSKLKLKGEVKSYSEFSYIAEDNSRYQEMKWLIIIFIAVFSFGCNDENDSWILPPNTALAISFGDSSDFLSKIPEKHHSHITGDYLEKMVYYVSDDNVKIYDEYTIANSTEKTYPYYKLSLGGTSTRFSQLSLGGRTWYIDWPNGQIDTLFANYREDSQGPNNCTCSEPLVELTLNGKTFIEKTDYSINGVYVFE